MKIKDKESRYHDYAKTRPDGKATCGQCENFEGIYKDNDNPKIMHGQCIEHATVETSESKICFDYS